VRVGEQLADWQAAIEFARTLPGVNPSRLAIWGFSASGGHIFPVAARNPGLAAAIAQTPLADAPAAAPNAMRYQSPLAFLRLTGRGLLDALGGLFGREPLLVPLAGKRGAVAVLTTPDAQDGDRALNPGNKYPDWQQEVAARSAVRIGFYRPAATPLTYGLRCWSSPATMIAPLFPALRSARRRRLRMARSFACPAATTSPSWRAMSRPSKPSCPSCAGICSAARTRRPAPRARSRTPWKRTGSSARNRGRTASSCHHAG
jgi:hypothetical protein